MNQIKFASCSYLPHSFLTAFPSFKLSLSLWKHITFTFSKYKLGLFILLVKKCLWCVLTIRSKPLSLDFSFFFNLITAHIFELVSPTTPWLLAHLLQIHTHTHLHTHIHMYAWPISQFPEHALSLFTLILPSALIEHDVLHIGGITFTKLNWIIFDK